MPTTSTTTPAAAAKKVAKKAAPKATPSKRPVKKAPSRSTTASDAAGSALQVLKDDHRVVERLFAQFERTGDRAFTTRQELVTRLIRELSIHASIEETVFYPAVREALTDDDLVLEALEEHHVVKLTLAELDGIPATAERYAAKVTVLMEMIRHHVQEEEDELFAKVRSAMTRTQLEQLGEALVAAKASAPERPHPHAPDTPPANLLAAAVTNPIDMARSVGEAAVRKVRSAIRP